MNGDTRLNSCVNSFLRRRSRANLGTRVVEPELLDELPADHPAAKRSRQDLRRVNWCMGNAHSIAGALQSPWGQNSPDALLELGAGDGHLLLQVLRKLKRKEHGTEKIAILLDRQKLLTSETRDTFA